MNEQLADRMLKMADALHWLGRYDESNACILMSRWMRARSVHDLDDLNEVVVQEEETYSTDDGEPVILYATTPTSDLTHEEVVYARGVGKLVVDKDGMGVVPTEWLTEWRKAVAGEMQR